MISWNVLREMDALRREMDHLFGDLNQEQGQRSAFLPGLGTRRYPRINLREDGDNFYLDALLPGVESKDLEINLTGNTLTLSGERQAENLEDARWQRQERGHGKFMRTRELPLDIQADDISAEYKDGVLHVVLPKAEEVKPRQIRIKVAS